MPRKIKVVSVADNAPVINETVKEVKVEVPAVVETPAVVELPAVDDASSTVVQVSDSEAAQEIKKVTTPEIKLPTLVEQKAKEQTGTCELCGKTMLIKNLKYSHPKVCKNRAPAPAPPPPPTPNIIVEKVVVMQNDQPRNEHEVEAPTSQLVIFNTIRQQRTEVRKQ